MQPASDEKAAQPVLLAAKLDPPTPRRRLIRRDALLATLSLARPRKLTLVDAPAGWGKTTLLGEWCSREGTTRPFAWLSLDEADNDPNRFWTYLVEALHRVAPSLNAAELAALQAPRTSFVEVMVPLLLNELASLPEPVGLVLDDYHTITNRELHDGLALLVDQLPSTLHLVVATRSDPPLPLARLRVESEMVEIRASELRFSAEEASALLNGVLGLSLADDDVRRLHQRTEGWAAGLYLAALSLRGRHDAREFIAGFAGDDRHVVDYLGVEVLRNQPEEVRRFLLRTSILERLSGALCDEVVDGRGSARILARIERSNLFLVPLDTKRKWYRYHRLFGQLLQHELAQTEPELVETLHRRAAAWFRRDGSVPEAIRHATAAGDVDDAADLIAEHWNAFFNQGRLATVDRWLDALPAEVVSGRSSLCVARAWLLLDLGRLDEAGRWIEQAERAAGAHGAVEDPEATVLNAVLRFKIGDVPAALRATSRVLEIEPEPTAFSRVVAQCLAGVTRYWLGEPAEAAESLEEGARLARAAGNQLGAAYATGYRALIEAERGEADEADALAESALHMSDAPGFREHFVLMIAHLARGRVLAQRGHLADSEEAVRRSVELSRRGAGLIEVAFALASHAELRALAADSREANSLLSEAQKAVERAPATGVLPEALARAERLVVPASRRAESTAAVGDELTERELAVLRLLPGTLSLREVGGALFVSQNTVKTHVRGIYRKLGASSRAEAVARARQEGLL